MQKKQLLERSLSASFKTVQHLWDDGETSEKHEFLLFLKPELTNPQVNYQKMLDLFFSVAGQHDVSLRECIVYPTQVVKERQLMENNYQKLNRIAHYGIKYCSHEAVQQIESLAHNGPILGGYQFLEKYPFFTPKSLSVMINNVRTIKLGYGTYASILVLFDQSIIVLNGFHPHQIESLTLNDSSIVAFRCSSNRSWKDIRSQFVGTIDPAAANQHSLRYQFWKHKETVFAEPFSIAYNGVHVSAGPLEAMHQYCLFFDKPQTDTVFWKTALKYMSADLLASLSPDSEFMQNQLYQHTEDLDMCDAIDFINKSKYCRYSF